MGNLLEKLSEAPRPATMVDWLSYPDRLTLNQAAFLVGRPASQIEEWVDTAAVDAWDGSDGETLIDKASLREFWEIYWEINDYLPQA